MRNAVRSSVPALAALVLLGACSRNPQPAAPAPQAAPAAAPAAVQPAAVDLSGDWNFAVELPGQRLLGVISLKRDGTHYSGTATASEGGGSATLTSLTIEGNRVVMVFDTPDGEARAVGILADARTMNGTVEYAGQRGPFTARKL